MICNLCGNEVSHNYLFWNEETGMICTNCAIDMLIPRWLKFLEWPEENEMKDYENTIWITKNQGRLYECSAQRQDLEDGGLWELRMRIVGDTEYRDDLITERGLA